MAKAIAIAALIGVAMLGELAMPPRAAADLAPSAARIERSQ